MAKDLTSIAQTSAGSTEKHLLSVKDGDAQHLAVVRLTSNWTDKVLVATPRESKFAQAYAYGLEAYPNAMRNDAVKNDTQILVDALGTQLATTAFASGEKAVYSYFNRSNDVGYAFANMASTTAPTQNSYAGVGQSIVAQRYFLRALPLGKMTSWKVYLRVHVLSSIASTPALLGSQSTGLLGPDTNIGGAYSLCVAGAAELPQFAGGVEALTDAETLDVTALYNDGHVASTDVQTNIIKYAPYPMNAALAQSGTQLPTRVYTNQPNLTLPNVHYSCDVELTGALKSYIGANAYRDFWLFTRFARANAFVGTVAGGTQTSYGLAPGCCAFLFAQRVELVFKLTGGSFN